MGGSTPVGAHLDRLFPRTRWSGDGHRPAGRRRRRSFIATYQFVHAGSVLVLSVLRAGQAVSEVAVYAREITEQKKSQRT